MEAAPLITQNPSLMVRCSERELLALVPQLHENPLLFSYDFPRRFALTFLMGSSVTPFSIPGCGPSFSPLLCALSQDTPCPSHSTRCHYRLHADTPTLCP